MADEMARGLIAPDVIVVNQAEMPERAAAARRFAAALRELGCETPSFSAASVTARSSAREREIGTRSKKKWASQPLWHRKPDKSEARRNLYMNVPALIWSTMERYFSWTLASTELENEPILMKPFARLPSITSLPYLPASTLFMVCSTMPL